MTAPTPLNKETQVSRRTKRRMHTLRHKPILRKIVATALFVFGVVALVLPLLPGWVFIGVGLYLLSLDSPEMQEKISHYRTKHRALDRLLTHSYDRLHRAMHRDDEV